MSAIVSRMSGAPARSRSVRESAPVSTPATTAAPARSPDSTSLAVSPATASSLTALLFLHGGAVSELAVAGDTASDVESGLRAGAGIVAGVLTGASSRADLERAGAPLILDTIGDILPHVLG